MKSVIVEIRGKYAAALSEDGSIIKIKNNGYAIGQQIITVSPVRVKPQKLIAMAACIALLLISGLGAYAYFTPYSYVSLDINPSVEFILNRFDCVLSAEGVNDDGRTIAESIELSKLRNRPIDYAVVHTINEISKHGYLEGPGISGIVIATLADNSKKAERLAAELRAAVEYELLHGSDQGHVDPETEDAESSPSPSFAPTPSPSGNNSEGDRVSDNNKDKEKEKDKDDKNKDDSPKDDKTPKNKVIIKSFNVSKDQVKKAKEIGVTPGRLRLVEKLQESAKDVEDIDIEQWLDKPVREIMKATRKYQNAQPDSDDNTDNEDYESNTNGETDKNTGSTDIDNKKETGKNNGKQDPSGKPGKADKSDKSSDNKNIKDKNGAGNVKRTGSKSDDDSRDRNTGKDEPQSGKKDNKADPAGSKNRKDDEKKNPANNRNGKSRPEDDSKKRDDSGGKNNPNQESKYKSGNKKIGNSGIMNKSKTGSRNNNGKATGKNRNN